MQTAPTSVGLPLSLTLPENMEKSLDSFTFSRCRCILLLGTAMSDHERFNSETLIKVEIFITMPHIMLNYYDYRPYCLQHRLRSNLLYISIQLDLIGVWGNLPSAWLYWMNMDAPGIQIKQKAASLTFVRYTLIFVQVIKD